MSEKILVVDDDHGMRLAISEVLKKRGYDVQQASSAEEGLDRIRLSSPDLILLDIRLPGMSGLEAISRIKELDPQCEIIVITAHGTRDHALEAVKCGAYDYFTKPFSLTEMEIIVRRALEKRRLQKEVRELRDRLRSRNGSRRIIGESECIRRLRALVERIAPLETTVLITGESGTGKELVADVIHSLSRRKEGPFVKINCAAIPETLLESELFGHEKGAFTGAVTQKTGKFELAQQGTILLDEIGDMPLSLQVKLLRVVEQKQIDRIGGRKSVTVDVRIIASTNQDLPGLIKEKKFREDLYYRLNVAAVPLPPLRERKDDLPFLVEHFLHQVNVRLGTAVSGISREAMDILFSHDWPGNVRELANLLERAVIFSAGSILTSEELRMALQNTAHPPYPHPSEDIVSLGEIMQGIEKNMILNALRTSRGVQTEAARALGLTPKNLWKKMKKYEIHKILKVNDEPDHGGEESTTRRG